MRSLILSQWRERRMGLRSFHDSTSQRVLNCSVWITATACLFAARRRHFVVFNECKMLQPDVFVACILGHMRHLSWSSSTGCQCQAKYSSNYARWCMTSKTASLEIPHRQNSASVVMTVDCKQACMATLQSVCARQTNHLSCRALRMECTTYWRQTVMFAC